MNHLPFRQLSGTGEKSGFIKPLDSACPVEANADGCRPDVPYVRESDFLSEEAFCEILSHERKRSERTQKKFRLMLLDVQQIIDDRVRCAIVRHVARVLADRDSEIRFRGWYRYRKAIGIVPAEALPADTEQLRCMIVDAAPPALHSAAASLKFLTFCFPNSAGGSGEERAEALFYPELVRNEKKRRLSLLLKRVMDIAGSAAAILLFAPVFIAVPLLIRAGSMGPVLFKQERIGRQGEKFQFLKFRTMFADNDPAIHQEYIKKFILEKKSYDGGPAGGVFKIKDDPRVTPIGRFLRKTSLDEFPQFFNVLKGEMSLVGPRPPIPYELENYDLWHLRRVMEIKPGITGLWQVQGRSSTTFDEMVRLDLKYANEWSLWLDIKILLKTPRVVLTGKGAY